MTVYKLTDDFEDDCEFTLIAIHSAVEDYRMAFLLNKYLGLGFKKVTPVEMDDNHVFQRFEWLDEKNDTYWSLIQNSAIKKEEVSKSAFMLFEEWGGEQTIYLLPEHKKVDFFIKIEIAESYLDVPSIVQKIQQIPNIVTTYKLATNRIKTRTNLIF
ncbi:IPExxxVDY family protein [Neptunitalea lumnitzerae]|uniref:IPExxxVDY family protein n=1 Tax=Neptunitalea lumnitzerae TaxID=2965509 RepID=A0ABQ5MG42_9FLAO|nr:IPExxxVDY family protein [Neptunitalea sp. Y10]GLB48281.1 hypothetical protein Y10_06490 [Neptunitalea sp. Y10]